MGKRRYRQPYWWFNSRLEHMPAGSFRHMFLRLPARQADPLHAVSSPSQSQQKQISAVMLHIVEMMNSNVRRESLRGKQRVGRQ
jgi:hypothetical protein